ncbi:MAG TPA: adenylate/guanylate cyclase domain-containing protein [Burkholderiaceae bacterium]|nr:adenylate/guanylate cyclase domain-containing protein [Burkholderiaceae bacterium]
MGQSVSEPTPVTYLFSDIEGSTRLWELEPDRMRPALARHDAISRAAVLGHGGTIVKMTGDGLHAAFDSPSEALASVLELQRALAVPDNGDGITLKVRCGLHLGTDERRRGDFFGPAVNRAARIMSAAHGGQILLSQAVADEVRRGLPAGVTLRDLGAVRLRDLATPERVYQVVDPQLRADFPALRSLEATPNNLAQQLNSFIGRERELAQVRAQLADHRLVTLLGMGGLGKSRLSVQLGADVMDDYPDGVWLVELAPISDASLVAQAVASVLGVKEEGGQTVLAALVRFVRDRQLLVILDNCEHVVHACAEVAKTLLQAGARVKILASSRDALCIGGETVFQLAPLPAPEDDVAGSTEALRRIDSVRLFEDRATAAQPAFRLTDENAHAVADICRRLDGIPLALELAAARLRALSAEAIATRLDDRFRLLVSGDRTALPRQRTLRALIDWSYDLLAPAERALFQALSVFAGGWTLEAAEAVGSGAGIDAMEVLDLLTSLVEKSLVIPDLESDRFRMLETVRQYAHERLQETDFSNPVRDRHLAFYLQLAERAGTELVGPDQGTWMERLDRERENLLVAHSRCGSIDDGAEVGLRLVFSTGFYFLNRGLLALGERISVEALARPQDGPGGPWRCRGLAVAGKFQFFRGRYREARANLSESLALARALGDQPRILSALQPLGMACLGDGDEPNARAYLEEAVTLAEQQNSPRALAAALGSLAQLCRAEGHLDEAELLCDRMLDVARELGTQDGMAIALLNKAMVSISRAVAVGVSRTLLETLGIAEEIGSRPIGQSVLEVTSAFAWLIGDADAAARFFGAAEALAQATSLHRDPADEAFLVPLIARVRETLGTDQYRKAETVGRGLAPDEAIKAAREWLDVNAR